MPLSSNTEFQQVHKGLTISSCSISSLFLLPNVIYHWSFLRALFFSVTFVTSERHISGNRKLGIFLKYLDFSWLCKMPSISSLESTSVSPHWYCKINPSILRGWVSWIFSMSLTWASFCRRDLLHQASRQKPEIPGAVSLGCLSSDTSPISQVILFLCWFPRHVKYSASSAQLRLGRSAALCKGRKKHVKKTLAIGEIIWVYLFVFI